MRSLSLFTANSFVLSGLLASLLFTGCSSKSSSSAISKVKPREAHAKAAAAKAGSRAEQSSESQAQVRSVFTVNHNARDPFYPNSKKVSAAVSTVSETKVISAADVLATLQQSFQGVLGAGDQRIALINNVMLEPGVQTQIPVGIGAARQLVAVRCRNVERDAVVLEVQGYAQPVRLVRSGN